MRETYDVTERLMFLSNLIGNLDNYSDNPTNHIISKQINVDPELIGGNVWKIVSNETNRSTVYGFKLNGFGYSAGGFSAVFLSSIAQYNDSNDIWLNKQPFPTPPRSSALGINLNNFGYIIGGYDGVYYSFTSKYNDSANTWSAKTVINTARRTSSAFNLNEFGYTCYGSTASSVLNSVEKYDDLIDVWTTKSTAGTPRRQTNSFVLNGHSYICGGSLEFSSTVTPVSSVDRYDDSIDIWTTKGNMSIAKAASGNFSISGFGYISSGVTSSSIEISNVDQYNDASNSWILKCPINIAVFGLSSFDINGFGYAASGYDTAALSTVQQYRSTNLYYMGRFKSSAKTPSKVLVATNCSAYAKSLPIWIRTDGTNWKYMESNVDSLVKQGQTVVSTLTASGGYYQYELMVGLPPVNTGPGASGGGGAVGGGYWSTKKPLAASRITGVLYQLNGFGYYQGGTITGGTTVSTNEQYNDQLDIWTSKTGITTAVYNMSKTKSLNGFGYIVSGQAPINSLVQQYNDSLNSWTSKAILTATGRLNAASFTLNGFMYCFGGLNAATATISSSEQYNDAANSWTAKVNLGAVRTEQSGLSISGFGYIIGGLAATSECNQYIDTTNVLVVKAPNLNILYDTGACQLGTLGYHFAGFTGTVYTSFVTSYNNITNIWISKTVCPTARRYCGVCELNNKGYLAGGYNATPTEVSTIEQYTTNTPFPALTVALNVLES